MQEHKNKRILMLVENAPFPYDERVRHESAALLAKGYHVTVISQKKKGQK